MYAKVESERLWFIRYNQAKLRSEEYINLRDAVVGNIDGNLNPNDIGNAFILPSSYIGSPRNMQEYIQDAMTYYSIEWQKRGLPHAHILIWLQDKIRSEEIDQIISAEIPDPSIDQELFDIVTKHMIHGPCGAFNMTSPCMENGKCKKKFPKPYTNDTITDIDGYPMYRRRNTENGGHIFTMRLPNFTNQVEFDNQWVVPYSSLLSKTYEAHINVELCSSVKSIKYICKYVNKGSDLAIFEVQNINKNDEITRYQMGRYISSNEAIWHILSFPIHERDPSVQHLAIHLENGQRVYFTEENVLQRALEAPKTTLTEFFTLCEKSDIFGQFAKTLIYSDVPRYFTWNKSGKKWEPRKQGKSHPSITGIFKAKTLRRLYTVHPKQHECFYLRLLLVNVPGPTSFEFLRTVNGRVFNTYQDACCEPHLLENDNHWDLTLAGAALILTPNNIRQLQTDQCQNIDYTPEMYNEALVLIEDLCVLISNLPLNHYRMPSPDRPATDLVNTDLQRKNRKLRLDFAKATIDWPDEFWNKVIFSDESKFNIFGSAGRRYVWRKPNSEFETRIVTATVKHGGRSVLMWDCMAANGVGNLHFIEDKITALTYIEILRCNLKASAEKLGLETSFVFQQDDSKHTKYKTREWLLYNAPRQLKTPPQSPDLNPIENLWH
ncbi:uncharacterized protein LOC129956648 [Argiope bruennichi]|uniref:uncharacterized protein LOC129956648 n=1 Tax=Argiope bruennichi TaxID=94029 RepID=UPI00249465A9|nr:uncharacterized protein LOC129956648 [Argiope bruennichi]